MARANIKKEEKPSLTPSRPRRSNASTLNQSITPTSAKSKSKSRSRSTPNARAKPTPTPKKATPSANTKSNSKRTPASTKQKPAKEDVDAKSDRSHSPTGMTETEESTSSSDGNSGDAFDPPSDEEEELDDEPIATESEIDSDNLDEDEDYRSATKGKKRKSVGNGGGGGSAKKVVKKGKQEAVEEDGSDEEDDVEDGDVELEEGQQIAGRIHPAPKTGQVPAGQISRNTFSFLKNLQNPAKNDRDWFRSHEPAFRQAEKEWHAFVGKVQKKFSEADNEIPILPPRDVIHRIYRDVRFSLDKTPYKKSFSMTTSRGGRKGIFACYHLSISPNSKSILACGIWQPGKNELATLRHHFTTSPQRFRDVIEAKEFVRLFGPAKVGKKGERQNVFGGEDALKVAPKGVDKGHKDIDLLKLRSVAVVHHFSDEDVLSEDFMDKIKDVVTVMTPFVHLLNDFISLPNDNGGAAPAPAVGGNAPDDHDDSHGDAAEEEQEQDE